MRTLVRKMERTQVRTTNAKPVCSADFSPQDGARTTNAKPVCSADFSPQDGADSSPHYER
ncbi:hypothetical protein [Microcoleus sp. CAWBG58]|uniref:hypothetical protein n=1 Tax=Microcoleus sp. CAWBG58 TaxID=2841651 RepID=UPI0025D05DEE|nr:hypothetical protein [Microcoleus sp. CAWBG58]